MDEKEKINALNIYKNIVNNKKDFGSIKQSIESAFNIDSKNSIEWFKTLATDEKHKENIFLKQVLIDILPEITKIDGKSASDIFFNILKPTFVETSFSKYYPDFPRKEVIRDTQLLWLANTKIKEIFEQSPKEILSKTLDLVILYRNIELDENSQKIIDVYSSIWYDDQFTQPETKLLKSIEDIAYEWSQEKNPKLDPVIKVLTTNQYSISKRLLVHICLANPEHYKKELFQLITSDDFLSSYDLLDLLQIAIMAVTSLLDKNEIDILNKKLLTFKIPDLKPELEGPTRKFLLTSVPEEYRNKETRDWLEQNGEKYQEIKPRSRSFEVTTNFEETKGKIEDKSTKFKKLSYEDQQRNIIKSLPTNLDSIGKTQKIAILDNIDIFLNRNEKVQLDFVEKIENTIHKYCSDPDPADNPVEEDYKISHTLISYPAVRPSAASCQLKLTWHNPTNTNFQLSLQLSQDENSFVRESVCRNLQFLADVNFPLSFEIATKFLKDNQRVLFFMATYLHFIVGKHRTEALKICTEIISNYAIREGKKETHEGSEELIKFVCQLVTYFAIKFDDINFKNLFNDLFSDKYNDSVKNSIAFICKSDDLLFDDKLKNEIIQVYEKLITDKSYSGRHRAAFFLLHSLGKQKKSYIPEIKPILDSLSFEKFDPNVDQMDRSVLIEYLSKFWKEIPEDSAVYLYRLFQNNPSLTYNLFGADGTVSLIENLLSFEELSKESQDKVSKTLMILVNAGGYKAIDLLEKLGKRD